MDYESILLTLSTHHNHPPHPPTPFELSTLTSEIITLTVRFHDFLKDALPGPFWVPHYRLFGSPNPSTADQLARNAFSNLLESYVSHCRCAETRERIQDAIRIWTLLRARMGSLLVETEAVVQVPMDSIPVDKVVGLEAKRPVQLFLIGTASKGVKRALQAFMMAGWPLGELERVRETRRVDERVIRFLCDRSESERFEALLRRLSWWVGVANFVGKLRHPSIEWSLARYLQHQEDNRIES